MKHQQTSAINWATTKPRRAGGLSCFLIALLVLATNVTAKSTSSHEFVPDYKIRGHYQLTDHFGNTVSEADFHGEFAILYFGFTHCPDICPTGLFVVATAVRALAEAGSVVRPLFVTVDPGRDTPQVLASYVGAFHPEATGLTGSREQVAHMAREFGVEYTVADVGGEIYVSHTSATFVVDPAGRFVRAFTHGVTAEELTHALNEELAEWKITHAGE